MQLQKYSNEILTRYKEDTDIELRAKEGAQMVKYIAEITALSIAAVIVTAETGGTFAPAYAGIIAKAISENASDFSSAERYRLLLIAQSSFCIEKAIISAESLNQAILDIQNGKRQIEDCAYELYTYYSGMESYFQAGLLTIAPIEEYFEERYDSQSAIGKGFNFVTNMFGINSFDDAMIEVIDKSVITGDVGGIALDFLKLIKSSFDIFQQNIDTKGLMNEAQSKFNEIQIKTAQEWETLY
jgi:hypothetical protein